MSVDVRTWTLGISGLRLILTAVTDQSLIRDFDAHVYVPSCTDTVNPMIRVVTCQFKVLDHLTGMGWRIARE